ncbi:hypothetical protein FACS18949_15780 [Clostridia bacterium]|nr:hypothetical protein FACS189425_10740 [Clostridia bacterium]GHV36401.1 hypothetical protein FACS18949_15780 [Clostridia bacterium]
MLKSIKRTSVIALALAVTLVIAGVTTAFAGTALPWGPNWFTPYHATASISSTGISGSGLQWSTSSVNTYNGYVLQQFWEFEFRNPNAPTLWGSQTGAISNLPSFYTEIDENDRTLGSHGTKSLSASTTYYGQVNYNPLPNYSGEQIEVESEYGTWILWDGLPAYWEANPTKLITGSVNSISW